MTRNAAGVVSTTTLPTAGSNSEDANCLGASAGHFLLLGKRRPPQVALHGGEGGGEGEGRGGGKGRGEQSFLQRRLRAHLYMLRFSPQWSMP